MWSHITDVFGIIVAADEKKFIMSSTAQNTQTQKPEKKGREAQGGSTAASEGGDPIAGAAAGAPAGSGRCPAEAEPRARRREERPDKRGEN